MSGKNSTHAYQLITNASMAGNVTSSPTDVQYSDNIGIQLVFTGTPTGTFFIQGSVNYDERLGTGDWSNLKFSLDPAANGSADNHLINLNQIPYKKIRVFYSRTSGSGTLNGWIMKRMIGS